MNLSYRLGASRQFSRFAAQQLLGMHALVDAKQIPVEKSHDFFQQVTALEGTIDDQAYTRLLHCHAASRKIPLLLALALGLTLIALALALLLPDHTVIRRAAELLATTSLPLPALAGLAAGLAFFCLIAAHCYVRAQQAKIFGKGLSAWWARILQRWAPDLAGQHEIDKLDPGQIAPLVAVHTRIHDVDLDLS